MIELDKEPVDPIGTLLPLEIHEIKKYVYVIANGEIINPDESTDISLVIEDSKIEFTGLPKLGKSTITQALSNKLDSLGIKNEYIEEIPVSFGEKTDVFSDWDLYMFNLAMFHGAAHELIQLFCNPKKPDKAILDRSVLGQIAFSSAYH